MGGDDQKWSSVLGSCLRFSLSSRDNHTYTQSAQNALDFDFLRCAGTNPYYVFSFFLPPSVFFFLFFFLLFFVRLVKFPLDRVWEVITGFSLEGWTINSHPTRRVCVIIFTNPSARAGYDTRSIFKQGLTGLNSEFSFSLTTAVCMIYIINIWPWRSDKSHFLRLKLIANKSRCFLGMINVIKCLGNILNIISACWD